MNLSDESLIEWVASWVPEANRARFTEHFRTELQTRTGTGNALQDAARRFCDLWRREWCSAQSEAENWPNWKDGFDLSEPLDVAFLALEAATNPNPSDLAAAPIAGGERANEDPVSTTAGPSGSVGLGPRDENAAGDSDAHRICTPEERERCTHVRCDLRCRGDRRKGTHEATLIIGSAVNGVGDSET